MGWKVKKSVLWIISFFVFGSLFCIKFASSQESPFVVGFDNNPPKLDPQDQYDSGSAKVIGQVCDYFKSSYYINRRGLQRFVSLIGNCLNSLGPLYSSKDYQHLTTYYDKIYFIGRAVAGFTTFQGHVLVEFKTNLRLSSINPT